MKNLLLDHRFVINYLTPIAPSPRSLRVFAIASAAAAAILWFSFSLSLASSSLFSSPAKSVSAPVSLSSDTRRPHSRLLTVSRNRTQRIIPPICSLDIQPVYVGSSYPRILITYLYPVACLTTAFLLMSFTVYHPRFLVISHKPPSWEWHKSKQSPGSIRGYPSWKQADKTTFNCFTTACVLVLDRHRPDLNCNFKKTNFPFELASAAHVHIDVNGLISINILLIFQLTALFISITVE